VDATRGQKALAIVTLLVDHQEMTEETMMIGTATMDTIMDIMDGKKAVRKKYRNQRTYARKPPTLKTMAALNPPLGELDLLQQADAESLPEHVTASQRLETPCGTKSRSRMK
jgi:hypothetical protein